MISNYEWEFLLTGKLSCPEIRKQLRFGLFIQGLEVRVALLVDSPSLVRRPSDLHIHAKIHVPSQPLLTIRPCFSIPPNQPFIP